MTEIKSRSYAKVNLSLDVLGKRPDGYHEVRMIMQTIKLHDNLTMRLSKGNSDIVIKTDCKYIPTDQRNLVHLACKEFFKTINQNNIGIEINIEKRIPVSAGLAGGSANAASVLKMLDRLLSTHMSMDDLCAIGERIGADVPFCIVGGTALCEGIGEKITCLKDLPKLNILLAKPAFSVSTPTLYKEFDRYKNTKHPDTIGLISAVESEDLVEVGRRMYNVFTDLVSKKHGIVNVLLNQMLSSGAIGATMSGTGPSVIGLFESEEKSINAIQSLKEKCDSVFITQSINRGEIEQS